MQGGAMENDLQCDPLPNGSLLAGATPRFKPCRCCTFDPNDWPQSDAKVKIPLHGPQRLTVVATRVRNLYQAAYDSSVRLFRPCQCCVLDPDDWPQSNAEIVIRPCMTACPYDGHVFQSSCKLRRHIAEFQAHKARNLTARAMVGRDRKRPSTAVAQKEAHNASNQGSPMDEDSADSGDDSGNDGDFVENILPGLSAAAQNNAHETGNQTYPRSQRPLLSIQGKNDHVHLTGSLRSSFSSTAVQNGALDTVKQESPIKHISSIGRVPSISDHQGRNQGSSVSRFSGSNSSSGNHGNIAGTFSLSSFSAAAQSDARDADYQNFPIKNISPIDQEPRRSDHQTYNQGSRMDQGSPRSNYGTNNQRRLVETLARGHSSAAAQNNIHDCGSQTHAMSQPPEPDQHKGIPAYAAEALRNTIKVSLATLCSDFMATAHSDLPRAQRDLDDLKQITNQYFSATESSFDIIRDRAES
ncbi:hypothetical protein V501_07975 [Pseudogymnoascus sp. VKM F-4519 (FW-2642)]|nr:hypothetical protein V501_07975 [Pseudogymnoascus sp. VKM F-4519 (FW-2642)]